MPTFLSKSSLIAAQVAWPSEIDLAPDAMYAQVASGIVRNASDR
jgi:hypothetical protein